MFPGLGFAHEGGGGGHGGGGGGDGHGFGGGGFGGHGFGGRGFGSHGFRSSFASLDGRGVHPGFNGTRRFADRGFFDRGNHDGFGRFDRDDRSRRLDRDDRFFFRHNVFVGFDFAAFGFPGWSDWGYPYGYGYYGENPSYGDASAFDYKYWDNLAFSVQSELSRSGYYTGQIDGVIGAGSREAIREFQAKEGLPVTGRIDPKLLDTLGIGYNRRQS